MPNESVDEEIATSVGTGASPIHVSENARVKALEEYVRSRSLVPLSWSENERYQTGIRFFGAGAASAF